MHQLDSIILFIRVVVAPVLKERMSYKRKGKTEIAYDENKAGYTATPVACGWAGAIIEACGAFGQEQYGQKPH